MKIVVLEKKNDVDLLKVNFLTSSKVKQIDLAYEDYEKEYEKRKNEIITKLFTIWRNNEVPAVYRNWVRQAARFINEKEI